MPALMPPRTMPLFVRGAQRAIEPPLAPQREERAGVAAAHVERILFEHERRQVGRGRLDERQMRRAHAELRHRLVEAIARRLGVAARGAHEAHARTRLAGGVDEMAVERAALLHEKAATALDDDLRVTWDAGVPARFDAVRASAHDNFGRHFGGAPRCPGTRGQSWRHVPPRLSIVPLGRWRAGRRCGRCRHPDDVSRTLRRLRGRRARQRALRRRQRRERYARHLPAGSGGGAWASSTSPRFSERIGARSRTSRARR